jgi:hypothetical protein
MAAMSQGLVTYTHTARRIMHSVQVCKWKGHRPSVLMAIKLGLH